VCVCTFELVHSKFEGEGKRLTLMRYL